MRRMTMKKQENLQYFFMELKWYTAYLKFACIHPDLILGFAIRTC